MNNSQKVLSDVVVYNKYAKYNNDLKRRETWSEIVDRYKQMLINKYIGEFDSVHDIPLDKFDLYEEIIQNSEFIYNKKVLPSMRALQFAGPAIEVNEARIYNCAFMPADDYRFFSELMLLLLGGTGVGYSVQFSHIEKLPEVVKPTKVRKYLIQDSLIGWADSIKVLMKSYFGLTNSRPNFDYRDIRAKGERLVTAGGKAPGPEPLRICLTKIESILREKKNGTKLTSLEVHRIACLIADAVLAGGIRRAAMICLFSIDDAEMLTCKHGNWWERYPELGRCNNSAVVLRNRVTKEELLKLWQKVKDSGSGEPGISMTDNPEYGFNPCHEISLRPFTFCNLTELNAGDIENQEDFNERCKIASFFGTLQAGFTDFHYLRSVWKKNTEKDALIGVGITGIGNGTLNNINLSIGADLVNLENERVSSIIGINTAARTTTIKPSGTTSCVLGTSSGVHAWHDKYYIRNMQCAVGDDLYNYFIENHPNLITVMEYDPNSAVIGIPQMAPETAILREDEDALKFLERVKRFNLNWVHPGYRRGPNQNNVSATCSIKDEEVPIKIKQGFKEVTVEKNEWELVGDWLWENKDTYSGISFLPYDGGTYKNAPFETCTKEEYEDKIKYIEENPIDLTKILEEVDNTTRRDNLACGPQGCEI